MKKTLHIGKIINLTEEKITLPNGDVIELEIVNHPGGAAIVAIDQNSHICLLKHYRHVAREWLWEVPAGKLEPDEAPDVTAQRELLEEAGATAHNWRSLGTIFSSPGIFDEQIHLYLATDLDLGNTDHEHGEAIEVYWLDIDEVKAMLADYRISDAKSIIAITRALALIESGSVDV